MKSRSLGAMAVACNVAAWLSRSYRSWWFRLWRRAARRGPRRHRRRAASHQLALPSRRPPAWAS